MKENLAGILGRINSVTSSTKIRAIETARIVFGIDTPLEAIKDGHVENKGKLVFRVDKRFDEYNLGGLEGINVSALTYAEQEMLNKL